MLLVALYTQKILGYDAWTAGLTLAPGGLGTMIALMISGRLVSRMDQRLMLAFGCLLAAVALGLMTHVTATMDFWNLAWPRFVQGFSMGFIFVPLQALALATIRTERLANATAAYNVVRNIGGSIGVALVTTLLARRSQVHQATLIGHLHAWNPAMADRLQDWTEHFVSQGADSFTAGRRAMAMLYRETVRCRPRCCPTATTSGCCSSARSRVLVADPLHAPRARRTGRRPASAAGRARPRPSGRRGVSRSRRRSRLSELAVNPADVSGDRVGADVAALRGLPGRKVLCRSPGLAFALRFTVASPLASSLRFR